MLIALALFAMQALPGSTDTVPVSVARAPVLRVWRTERAPTIDGRLDEAVWASAPVAAVFWQRNPQEGAPATQRTEVRVLYDQAALYIGARLFEADAHAIRSVLMRRDGTTPSDQFTVILDSEHDHQSAMRFTVNPRGVRADALLSGDSEDGDPTWDPVWHVATGVDGEGWTAEMRIPLSQLRFRGGERGEWGVNFERYLASRQETDSYVPLRRAENGYVSRFAHLTGLADLRTPHALDVMPYVSGRLVTQPAVPQGLAAGHLTTHPRAGLDLRYGLTSSVTFVATVNPDFGQVEADPATLNLSEFETVFEERRPFFQEGAPVFGFGQATGSRAATAPRFFYSRRIGGAPTLSPDVTAALGGTVDSLRSPFVESPTSTAILGAAKLTGSLAHGVSFGVLHAETGREFASVTGTTSIGSTGGGARVRQLLEPRGHYSVGRVRQDLRDGSTSIGLIATSVMRDFATPRLDSSFAARAYGGGIDWRHRWDRRRFGFDGWVGWSYVGGSPTSVTQVQRSPVHYLQRPDRRGTRLDSSRVSLAGAGGAARLGYDGPSGLSVSLDGTATSPGFELNAIGYLASTDERSLTATVGWQQPRPSARLQSYGLSAYGGQTWTGSDGRLAQRIGTTAFAYAQSGWGGTTSLDRSLRGVSTTAARGGPLVVAGARTTVSYSVLTDPRRALALVGYGAHSAGEYGDRSTELGASLTWRPSASVQLSLDPTLARSRDAAAYVTDVPDTLATTTFGRRYVFAALSQRSAGVAFRADLAFAPDLGLQLYVQPFGAVARYADLGELRRPRSFEFGRYGSVAGSSSSRDDAGAYAIDPDGPGPAEPFVVADPDFAFRSLTGNAVLRWEYRPGATVYLVWTQRRSGADQPVAFRVGDLRAAFDQPPENVLLLKVSARWGK